MKSKVYFSRTITPEKVLEYGRQFGEFVTIKIENMSVQHSEIEAAAEEIIEKPVEKKEAPAPSPLQLDLFAMGAV